MDLKLNIQTLSLKCRLDIGEGKEVNIIDKCPRSKLQQQCIKYLGPVSFHILLCVDSLFLFNLNVYLREIFTTADGKEGL